MASKFNTFNRTFKTIKTAKINTVWQTVSVVDNTLCKNVR